MPTIAQKLCRDIVEPAFKPSSNDTNKRKSSGKSANSLTKQRSTDKSTRSVNIEKKKVVNKTVPSHSGSCVRGLKSKETIVKKRVAESGINTLISGPLRCDNNCITLVRKRDHQITCKCGQQKKLNCKASAKQIQTSMTKNYSYMDKACTHCVETANCGTQFWENTNLLKSKSNNKSYVSNDYNKDYKTKVIRPEQVLKQSTSSYKPQLLQISKNTPEKCNSTYRPLNVKYIGAKRWVISNYPLRGPDF